MKMQLRSAAVGEALPPPLERPSLEILRTGLFGLCVAIVGCGAFSPMAAAQTSEPGASVSTPVVSAPTNPRTRHLTPEQLQSWRAALPKSLPPELGCYRAEYPSATWRQVPCVTPPNVPYRPTRGGGPASPGNLVGNGNDYVATTTKLINNAAGGFTDVTGVLNEADQGTANRFSLQLNTNFFSGSPACNSAVNPSSCLAWEQFVYSNSGVAFIQYWLIDYDKTCPKGWNTSGSDCWKNAPTGAAYGPEPISDLGTTVLGGSASKGGKDGVLISGADGAASADNTDSVLDLAKFWNNAEFNIVGDCCATSADFNSGVSITVSTYVDDNSSAAPGCPINGTTGEMNNLDLPAKCAATKGTSSTTPYISFTETNPPGSIWKWEGSGCGSSCTSWQELDNNNNGVRIAATDSKLFEMWNSGNIWMYTGTPCSGGHCPGWTQISTDANAAAIEAGGNNVYRLDNNGDFSLYTGGTSWQLLDNNKTIVTTAASAGGVYELHNNGDIWKYTGTPCSGSSCPGWQLLDNNSKAVAIAAANDNLYEFHNDGTIWKYTGTPCSDNSCPGWQLLANNGNAITIAAGGNNLYELDSTGDIWQYTGPACSDNSCPGWKLLDNNPVAFNIAADSNNVYELHNNGALYHYTGTPCTGSSCPGWELIDNNGWTGRIAATAGNFYEVHVVRTPPSRSLICYDCR